MKVYLGGTCNNSTWRDEVIPKLKIDYFNPVVDDWTEEAYQKELYERAQCDYLLYVITSQMSGVYSVAEAVDDSNKHPEKTIFCVLKNGFNPSQLLSLDRVGKMIAHNGGRYFDNLPDVIAYLNGEHRVYFNGDKIFV